MLKKPKIFLFIIILFIGSAYGADVVVPNLELITRGYFDETDNKFKLTSIGDFDIRIQGGFKFGGNISLGFMDRQLETLQVTDTDGDGIITDEANYTDNSARASLKFKGANVTIKDLFGTPLDMNYFTGEFDPLGSGDVFPRTYGTERIATRYRGYLYFPDPTDPLFEAIYIVTGTGLSFSTGSLSEKFKTTAYIYQDELLGVGYYSGDLSTVVNLDSLKIEFFAGSSFPVSEYGIYRGGLLLFAKPSEVGDFLLQFGIPRWDPLRSITMEDTYILFEPRFHLNFFSLIFTVFKHPGYYLQQAILNEGNIIDLNINFMFGDVYKTPLSGGMEFTIKIDSENTDSTDSQEILISPYLNTVTSGIIWIFRIRTKVWPIDNTTEMVQGFIGIQAEF